MSVGVNVRGLSRHAVQRHDRRATTTRDGVFNDRPAGHDAQLGARRVAGRPGRAAVLRVGFGKPRPGGRRPAARRSMIAMGGGGGGLAPGFGGGAEDKRYRVEVLRLGPEPAQPRQLHGYSFVLTSPFFGQPVAAAQPRKLQVGVRFGF